MRSVRPSESLVVFRMDMPTSIMTPRARAQVKRGRRTCESAVVIAVLTLAADAPNPSSAPRLICVRSFAAPRAHWVRAVSLGFRQPWPRIKSHDFWHISSTQTTPPSRWLLFSPAIRVTFRFASLRFIQSTRSTSLSLDVRVLSWNACRAARARMPHYYLRLWARMLCHLSCVWAI